MLVDLTHRFRDGMFSQPLFPPVSVTRCVRFEDKRINVTKLDVCVHHGTHIDAPVHFVPGGRTVADLELEEVSGAAIGLDLSGRPPAAITARDLDAAGAGVQDGDLVFLHTGWGRWFSEDPARYEIHPYLAVDAARWLVDRRVKLVALDVPSPDMPVPLRGPGFDWPIHHLLLESGTLIAEHLANLDRVAGRRFRALGFPLPIVGADGSPVRMVAELEDGDAQR
jgi:kynurenine formamidase